MSKSKIYFRKIAIVFSVLVLIVVYQNCGDSFELGEGVVSNSSVPDSANPPAKNDNIDPQPEVPAPITPMPVDPPVVVPPIVDPLPVEPTPVVPTPVPLPPVQRVPVGASFLKDTHKLKGGRGDNFTLTWASDDSVYVSMDDGNWARPTSVPSAEGFSHAMYKIDGNYDFTASDISIVKNYPVYPVRKFCHFGHGLLAAGETIYSFVSQCGETYLNSGSAQMHWSQYFAVKLLKSTDNGRSWKIVLPGGTTTSGFTNINQYCTSGHKYFFCKEGGRTVDGQKYYSFGYNAIVQAGKGYRDRTDEYIYVYSPVPRPDKTFDLELARAPINGFDKKSNWRYFTSYNSNGTANWSSSFSSRKPVIRYTKPNINWYSYLPDVTYNKGLDLYIMVNHGIHNSDFNARGTNVSGSGSLHLSYSKNPYGPWTEFKYVKNFYVKTSAEKTYQLKLDPKRISSDGTEMVLVWSDFSGDFGYRYTFNEMKIKLQLSSPSVPVVNTSHLLRNKMFSKCMYPAGGSVSIGALLEVTTCSSSSSSQEVKFEQVTGDNYKLKIGSYCIGLQNDSTANGTRLQLQSCSSSKTTQQFNVRSDQLFSVAKSSSVIDVHMTSEKEVILWENAGNQNQRFYFE